MDDNNQEELLPLEDELLTEKELTVEEELSEEVPELESSTTTVTLPSEITVTINNQQYETLILKLDETKESVNNNSIVISILLGVLIGIVFVRGLSRYVKGV